MLKHALKYDIKKSSLWLIAVWSFLLLSACSSSHKDEIDELNSKSYAFHYRNLDSTRIYAERALKLSDDYSAGKAEAYNNLAFVSIVKMDYDRAYNQLDSAVGVTDNQIELLIADVQYMRLCQRQSRNKDFYDYRERAIHRQQRIGEELGVLSEREQERLTYANSEFDIVASTYFYYVGLKKYSAEALMNIDPYGTVQKDTAQLIAYYYNIGAGGIISNGNDAEIAQREFEYLVRGLVLSDKYSYHFWKANIMEAISEHLQEPEARDRLIMNNLPAMKYINSDNMPDSLLAGNLAQHSLDLFYDYGDVYQTAGAFRTLASCYWAIRDYRSSIICLNDALNKDTVINRAPDLVASIREQLSLAYSAIDEKQQSDYNRNIYLDMQEKTRQDRQLEARAAQLDKSSLILNWMIVAVILAIIIVIFLLMMFDRMRKKGDVKNPIGNLLKPLEEWKTREEKRIESEEDKYGELNENIQLAKLHSDNNRRRNIEQRAKMSLVNSITPFIDRILHEIECLKTRTENEECKERRYSYISELTAKINDYNSVLTQWIQLRQGQLSLHIESFKIQELFNLVKGGKMGFLLKDINLEVCDSQDVVKADKTLTLFMINTLADNARKFTGKGGCVKIYSKSIDEYVEISVEDNGMGMTTEQTTRIFEHKTIVDESLKSEKSVSEKSHGFGLMNCVGIINKYHKISKIFSVCSINVESKKGKGSRFFFRLPKGISHIVLFFVMLTSAQCVSAANKNIYLRQASRYADSAYFSNINGHYERTLFFADTCRHYLNEYYRQKYPEGRDTMSLMGNNSESAEIKWFRKKLDTNYPVILDIRNESAVAALALHLWSIYHYNNKVYTQLFRETSADASLDEYVRVMQKSETSKNVAIVILILLFVSIFPAYYFLYYRHRLFYNLCLDSVNKINGVLLTDKSSEEKLRLVNVIWDKNRWRLTTRNSALNKIVEQIKEALQKSISKETVQKVNLELAKDELHRVEYENDKFYVSNSVLDNCLSTLKHETMYYPSRISQLVDNSKDDIMALSEVALYYKELYSLLSAQGMRQIETNLKVDKELTDYLFLLLKKLSGEKTIKKDISELDANYVIIKVRLPSLLLSQQQRADLFTPSTINTGYMLCRQIVREIGETTNLRGCGIQAVQAENGGTIVKIVLPAKLKIKY